MGHFFSLFTVMSILGHMDYFLLLCLCITCLRNVLVKKLTKSAIPASCYAQNPFPRTLARFAPPCGEYGPPSKTMFNGSQLPYLVQIPFLKPLLTNFQKKILKIFIWS